MSGRVGSITTDIIADGLVFNMDAANRASYVEYSDTSYNTVDLTQTQTLYNDPSGSLGSPKGWEFDGVDSYVSIGNVFSSYIAGGNTGFESSFSFWLKSTDVSSNMGILDFRPWYVNFGVDLDGGEMQPRFMLTGVAYKEWSDVSGSAFDGGYHNWTLTIPYNGDYGFDVSTSNFYLDGGIQGVERAQALIENQTWNNFILGKTNNLGYFNGSIASVQVYNRALSANEVLHNFNALKGRFGL